jgi:putative intracellular protease/amidase
VLPGGMPGGFLSPNPSVCCLITGILAERLRDSHELTELLRKQKKADKLYGAICASPAVVLQHHGLLEVIYTCVYADHLV